jgi:hypothetical protein
MLTRYLIGFQKAKRKKRYGNISETMGGFCLVLFVAGLVKINSGKKYIIIIIIIIIVTCYGLIDHFWSPVVPCYATEDAVRIVNYFIAISHT